jgi:hypothetical protein
VTTATTNTSRPPALSHTADLTFTAPAVSQWIDQGFADQPEMIARLTGHPRPEPVAVTVQASRELVLYGPPAEIC